MKTWLKELGRQIQRGLESYKVYGLNWTWFFGLVLMLFWKTLETPPLEVEAS